MIDRYGHEKMRALWSLEHKYQTWLQVEVEACAAWSDYGIIPQEDVVKIRQHAKVDVNRVQALELQTRHDVVAFTRAMSESLGEESKWVHYGLTSTDVVDTAQGIILKEANEILRLDMGNLIQVLSKKAIKHKHTVMIGRTHGVHAEPTTFGLTLALWQQEMVRNIERFEYAASDVEVGKLSGAVGTHSNIPLVVEQQVCHRLGISAAPISTQVLQRDRHAHYMSTLALIASSIEKMAVQIRHMQRSEVREVEELFNKGQKGSSAMPHKRNPIGSENLSGLARVMRGYMIASYENIPLWHERDISHSSVERIILPDATILLDYMLKRFTKLIDELVVFEKRMEKNIMLTYGVVYSQQVLNALIEAGLTREAAYDLVQPLAMQAWDEETSFYSLLLENEFIRKYLDEARLLKCFDPSYHLQEIDALFEQIGLS